MQSKINWLAEEDAARRARATANQLQFRCFAPSSAHGSTGSCGPVPRLNDQCSVEGCNYFLCAYH